MQQPMTIDPVPELIRGRLRGLVKDLRVLSQGTGLILRGRSRTFYGKQMAQEEIMKLIDQPIVSNEIEVHDAPEMMSTQ
jgi:hypothetical protein